MHTSTASDLLKAISDSESRDIFCSIAKNDVEIKELKQTRGLTRKQYYLRMRQLLNSGLVERKNGRFSLTCLGAIVYDAQLVIESGINNFWKLKAIDSIQELSQIAEQERVKLIKTILNDNTIENILVKSN